MKNLFLLFVMLTFSMFNSNNALNLKPVDCWAFADTVEGQAGDSGDYEVWSEAFEHCCNEQGIETVIIKN